MYCSTCNEKLHKKDRQRFQRPGHDHRMEVLVANKSIQGEGPIEVGVRERIVRGNEHFQKYGERIEWVDEDRCKADAIERFFQKVDVSESGCWLWTGTITPNGYSKLRVDGKDVSGHRFIYQVCVGPIPVGQQIDHLCRVRHCVNPEHLETVTCRENILRGEGVAAQAAKVTHCPKGHEYTPENTYTYGGQRHCRECVLQRGREYKRRVRQQAQGSAK